MGLITGFLIKKALTGTAFLAAEKIVKHNEKHHGKEAVMKKLEFEHQLFVEKKSIVKKFNILDKDSNKKYIVTAELMSPFEKTMRCKTINDKNVCRVYSSKNLFTKRVRYHLVSGNKELGEIIPDKFHVHKHTFSFNNWIVQGKGLNYDLDVKDKKGESIIRIHEIFSTDKFVI